MTQQQTAIPPHFIVSNQGIYYWRGEQSKEDPLWLCSRIDVIARTSCHHDNHGKLLQFKDDNGHTHYWAMPKAMLAGDGAEYRRILLRKGVDISPHRRARTKLTAYLQGCKPEQHVICVQQPGWHEQVFVLPDAAIAQDGQPAAILQTDYGDMPGFQTQGKLDDWQRYVAQACVGNSRLVFAISCAFAAPLLRLLNQESGGFHLRGVSSCGKTTALTVACSVWGEPARLQLWRTTDNGLEAIAKQHNDSLLCLDELGQLDPRIAGESAYMLANGMGKLRSRKDGTGLPKQHWRLLFLSTGEISLAQHIQSMGQRCRAGQQLRLLDIPADAGQKLGIFDTVGNGHSAAQLANYLRSACRQYYGTPIRHFLQRLVQQRHAFLQQQFQHYYQQCRQALNVDSPLPGQVDRTLYRFALVACAGELATRWQITGWPDNSAVQAAVTCFQAWQQENQRGLHEAHDALAQVRFFFEKYGNSRFAELHTTQSFNHERAGFRHKGYFLVFPEVFRREICAGLDYRFVSSICQQHHWLITDSTGKYTTPCRLPEHDKPVRLYKFTQQLLTADVES